MTREAGAQVASSSGTSPGERSYGLPLAITYAATPLVAVAGVIAFGDADSTTGGIAAGSVAAIILGGPLVVHASHGHAGRGVTGALLTAAFTAGGFVGFAIGGSVWAQGCPTVRGDGYREERDEGCTLQRVLWPAFVGAVAGYATWAVIDVSRVSSVAPPKTSALEVVPVVRFAPRGGGFIAALGRF